MDVTKYSVISLRPYNAIRFVSRKVRDGFLQFTAQVPGLEGVPKAWLGPAFAARFTAPNLRNADDPRRPYEVESMMSAPRTWFELVASNGFPFRMHIAGFHRDVLASSHPNSHLLASSKDCVRVGC